MPPFRTLQPGRPDPFAGQNVKAFQQIIQSMGKVETMRQNRMIESSVLTALTRGASSEELAEIAGQPVQFDKGIPGFFQRIAAKYAGPSPVKTAITEGLAKEAISPDKVTMSDIRMREYLKAIQAGDSERADKLLMSSLVTIETGDKLLTPEQRQSKAEKDYEKSMEELPLSKPQIAGYGEDMNVRIDKAKKGFLGRPGRTNYPEKELFKQWEIFAGMHKFKNDTQKEQIWNVWQNKIKNRAAEGWFGEFFGKEAEIDTTDPKWRNALGLSGGKLKESDRSKKVTEGGIPPPPDARMLEDAVGPENARMETKAWGVIYDLWGDLSKGVQDKIRTESLSGGKSFTELLNEPDVMKEVEALIEKSSPGEDMSLLSDEELKRIAEGG